MPTREQIVRQARSWLGTRWHHQASTKGVGTDCVGLVRGVAIETGVFPRDLASLPGASQFLGYGRLPFKGMLEKGCGLYLQAISATEAGPGDLVVMEFNGQPHHMGVLGWHPCGGLSIIHAYAPRRMVVESRLDDSLRARIVSWHRFPGVEA